jgi:integrase
VGHYIPGAGEIKPADIERYRGQRKKNNGKPAKLQTINNDQIILKHCLNVARRKGLLTVDPASLVPMPNAHNERDRVLTSEEWKRQILGLTWDRIDLSRGFITLRAIDTKTKKPRQVSMTHAVKAALQDLTKVRSLAHKNVFVRSGQPYTYEPVRTAFKKAESCWDRSYDFTT